MKKFVLLLGFMFSVTFSYAVDFNVSRSTVISSVVTNFQLTTATVMAWRLEVSSGNPGSTFVLNGGTVTSNFTSTQTFDTSSAQNHVQQIEHSLLGLFITTKGQASETRFYWDYIGLVPKGQESYGRQRK